MHQRLSARLLAMAALIAFGGATASGLEGGLTTTSRDWSRAMVPTMIRPSAKARKAELAQRERDIAAQVEALQARLKRTPDAALKKRIDTKLTEIYDNYGWVPQLKIVMGRRNMDAVRSDLGEVDPQLMRAFVRFRDDLAERDIDLIVMPFPTGSWIYTHLLVDGADAQTEYYPGYTRMLLQFLENDIEIVDALDEMRAQANSKIDMHWPNDPHTGTLGRQIAARALAQRLQRYDFARNAASRAKQFSYVEVDFKGARWDWCTFYKNGGLDRSRGNRYTTAKGAPEIEKIMRNRPMRKLAIRWPDGQSVKRPLGRPDVSRDGLHDLVLIGDSQLHSGVHGDRLPEFVWAELGGICRWGSKSWSGFSLPNIYLETVPNRAAHQPRVVVASFLFFRLMPQPGKYKPRPLPEMEEGDEEELAAASRPFNARVRILEVSKPRDPRKLVYKEALMMATGEIVDGPMQGTKIGLCHWGMINGRILKPVPGLKRLVDTEINLELTPWRTAIKNDSKLQTYQTFDDTTVSDELDTPVFWVTRGKLDPAAMRSR